MLHWALIVSAPIVLMFVRSVTSEALLSMHAHTYALQRSHMNTEIGSYLLTNPSTRRIDLFLENK